MSATLIGRRRRSSVRRSPVRSRPDFFFIFVNAAHKNEAGPELQRGRGEICVAKIEMYDMGIDLTKINSYFQKGRSFKGNLNYFQQGHSQIIDYEVPK